MRRTDQGFEYKKITVDRAVRHAQKFAGSRISTGRGEFWGKENIPRTAQAHQTW